MPTGREQNGNRSERDDASGRISDSIGGFVTTGLQVLIPAGNTRLAGDLAIPDRTSGIIIFAHSNGSRHNLNTRRLATALQQAGFATLLMDLLTPQEASIDDNTDHFRFDIELLRGRLIAATSWVLNTPELVDFPIGYLGWKTGAAAALEAASQHPEIIKAIVLCDGRPDLVESILPKVKSATLCVVESSDYPIAEWNRQALKKINGIKKLITLSESDVRGRTVMDQVAILAGDWFREYLTEY